MSNAEYTYYDVTDDIASATPNTFNAETDLADWGGGDDGGSAGWRYRSDSGPGVPAFNNDVFTGKALNQGGETGADPNLYTLLDGLAANTEYIVRVYMVMPDNTSSRHWAEFSLDDRTTWEEVSNFSVLDWVDNSSGVGAEDPDGRGPGDSRAFYELENTGVSDGSGQLRIDIQLPENIFGQGGSQDRFNIDGYAVEEVEGADDPSFKITAISRSPEDDMITLTWNSKEGETYDVNFSLDLEDWDGEIEGGIIADSGDETTRTFDLALAGLEENEKVFFRVEGP